MSSLVERVKSSLGFGTDEFNIGCRAIIDEKTGEVCGNDVWGRGSVDGHEVKYCKEDNHVPSGATPWGGRVKPLLFYIPEDDVTVEVE